MPGSPPPSLIVPSSRLKHPVHPAAHLLSLALLGAGLAAASSWPALALGAAAAAVLALRTEARSWRAEVPLLGLALIVFLAHALLVRGPRGESAAAAAAIALRMLALVYLLRWAARASLGRAGRWLLGLPPPRRPRVAALAFESARLATALLPLALREAEQHVVALRARGIRAGRGAAGRGRYLAAWFLPFLGTMLRVSDAFADALLARGHAIGVRRRAALETRWGAREWAAVGLSAAAGAWLARG